MSDDKITDEDDLVINADDISEREPEPVKKKEPEKEKPVSTRVVLPSTVLRKLVGILEELETDDSSLAGLSDEWVETVKDSQGVSVITELEPSTDDGWDKSPEYEGKGMGFRVPTVRDVRGKKLTGASAVLLASRKMGLGTPVTIPLYSSGFWVTIKPPTGTEVYNFITALASMTSTLGRDTYGFIYSNLSVVINAHMATFISDHIHSSTLKVSDDDDIMNYVRISDFYTLIWGLVTADFPEGIEYSRACLTKDCGNVVEGKIDPKTLFYVNSRAIPEKHRIHMARTKPNWATVDDIRDYQETLPTASSRKVKLTSVRGQEVYFVLKLPTIPEQLDAGNIWLSNITNMVENAVSEESDEVKEGYMRKHTDITMMREFEHYVEAIEFDTNVVTDKSTIGELMAIYSADKELRKGFSKAVTEYVDHTSISVIGIEEFECPHCGELQKGRKSKHHSVIIPLETLETFFILAQDLA